MDIPTQVEMLAVPLELNETRYVDCPACGRANKMGITKDPEGTLYHCFSSHCGAKGKLGVSYTPAQLSGVKQADRDRRYNGVFHILTEEDEDFFIKKFQLVRELLFGNIYRTVHGEYGMPIRQPRWNKLDELYRVGEVVRQPWEGAPIEGRPGKPKALTYIYKEKPRLAFYGWDYYGTRIPQRIVLVEDQISALKIAQATESAFWGVAMLGNSISDRECTFLAHFGADLYFWLDPDMGGKAFELNAKYGTQFRMSKVIMSDEDPKDTDLQLIRELLYD